MHPKILSVILACASGGFVGALAALEINGVFWWLGLLAGGFVGYIVYDFRTIIKALPIALEMTIAGSRQFIVGFLHRFIFGIKRSIEVTIVASNLIPLVAFFGYVLLLLIGFPGNHYTLSFLIVLFGVVILIIILGLIMTLFMVSLIHGEEAFKDWPKNLVKNYNPFRFYFFLLPKGLYHAVIGVKYSFLFTARFFKYLFILIHSDLRLLCAVDAALGASVGYFFGNALIGALAGAVIGFLNFEVVSIRLLRIARIRL